MADGADAQATTSVRRAWAVYTLLRLALFLGAAVLIALTFRVNGFPLLLVALLVSSVVSLFVLQPQRNALVLAQEARGRRRREERERQRRRLDEEPGATGS